MITEVLRKESEKQRRIGVREGIRQERRNVIIQMLKLGVKEDMICKYTNTSKEKLEKIKSKI